MGYLNPCVEHDDLGGGKHRRILYLRPVAYLDGSTLRAIVSDFTDGDAARPHLVTRAPLMVSVSDDGGRRLHPTRELTRYLEVGRPLTRDTGSWQPVGFSGAVRTGNRISWSRPQARLDVLHGGHFCKLGIELLGGYVPSGGQVAFPVVIQGLTRQGANILADGVVVGRLRAPHVEDIANREDVRPVTWEFVSLGGQVYLVLTLPLLSGMVRPYIDPTYTLPGDATFGKDTFIELVAPTFNYGASILLQSGETTGGVLWTYRVLLQPDLSGIPATDTCDSATLTLTLILNGDQRASNNRTGRIYRVLQAWTEGTGNGSATGDGATWNTYNGVSNWQTAGCEGANDVEAGSIGSCAFATTDLAGDQKNFSLDPASVQDWWDGGLTNNGMLWRMDTEINDAYRCASSDHGTAGYRPKLVIVTTAAGGNPWYYYAQQGAAVA